MKAGRHVSSVRSIQSRFQAPPKLRQRRYHRLNKLQTQWHLSVNVKEVTLDGGSLGCPRSFINPKLNGVLQKDTCVYDYAYSKQAESIGPAS